MRRSTIVFFASCAGFAACTGDTMSLGDASSSFSGDSEIADAGNDAGELGGDAAQRVCNDRSTCAPVGDECLTGDQRCDCVASFGMPIWTCESADCPRDFVAGEACDMPGLMCGAEFEGAGSRCVSPENIWVNCGTVRGLPGEQMAWCPPAPPVIGAPCCVVNPAFRPDECNYGQDRIRCDGSHWAQL